MGLKGVWERPVSLRKSTFTKNRKIFFFSFSRFMLVRCKPLILLDNSSDCLRMSFKTAGAKYRPNSASISFEIVWAWVSWFPISAAFLPEVCGLRLLTASFSGSREIPENGLGGWCSCRRERLAVGWPSPTSPSSSIPVVPQKGSQISKAKIRVWIPIKARNGTKVFLTTGTKNVLTKPHWSL